MLRGTVFAPPEGRPPGAAVVLLPGSGGLGNETNMHWQARDLAAGGYVVLSLSPQGTGRSDTAGDPPCPADHPVDPCPGIPYQQLENWLDAGSSGLDFALSDTNPFAAATDRSRAALVGYSLGARAVSVLQGRDDRVDAAVALDNLASDGNGDAGSPSGGGAAGTVIGGELPGGPPVPVTPRVPAIGLGSDGPGPGNTSPSREQKKTAYSQWRSSGLPTMELVFRGVAHGDFSQNPRSSNSTYARLFAHYTRAWLDRYLGGDAGAVDRLLAGSVAGRTTTDFLSLDFASAAYLPADDNIDSADDGIDCDDLTHDAGCLR
ncbi:MAG: hypothetical protein WD844_13250 [Thermoleophilaceae bacterium]